MAGKKSRNKNSGKPRENKGFQPNRTLQIFFVVFSIILILSMLLALTTK